MDQPSTALSPTRDLRADFYQVSAVYGGLVVGGWWLEVGSLSYQVTVMFSKFPSWSDIAMPNTSRPHTSWFPHFLALLHFLLLQETSDPIMAVHLSRLSTIEEMPSMVRDFHTIPTFTLSVHTYFHTQSPYVPSLVLHTVGPAPSHLQLFIFNHTQHHTLLLPRLPQQHQCGPSLMLKEAIPPPPEEEQGWNKVWKLLLVGGASTSTSIQDGAAEDAGEHLAMLQWPPYRHQ